MELGNTVRAAGVAGKAGVSARALVRMVAAVLVSLSFPSESQGAFAARNPPSECRAPDGECPCASGKGAQNKCIKVTVGMGVTTPWTGSLACSLKVFADDQSPMVFTPDSLYAVVGGYTFKRIGNGVLSDGVTPAEVVLSHPNGESVRFVFTDGESLGRPDPGFHVPMDERLQMVDAQGWATAHDPVYWDLLGTDGTVRRFLASNLTGRMGALVSVTDSRGVVTTPADMGVDLVYGPDGVRQFLTPSRLADVRVGASGYTVTVYPVGDPPARDPATGLYPLPDRAPVERVSIEGGADGRRATVTIRSGGGAPRRYVYEYVRGDWSMTRPSGVGEWRERAVRDSECARTVRTVVSPGREVLSRDEYNYVWCDWGFAATNHVEGFGGVTRTTGWTYCTSGGGRGRVRTSLSPAGLLTEYAYDAKGRELSVRRSGPGMMAEGTAYSYAPVDASDAVPPVDSRPRTTVRTLDGVECGRTYRVYSPLTNVVERAAAQGAPYGAPGALRTVTAFYPVAAGDVRSGRIRSVRREDGRLDLHDYALAGGVWTETVTHLHERAPEPVPGRTTRDVTVTNARGETVERRTEAFVGGAWHAVSRERRTYDETGRCIRTEDLAGRATVTDWDCCRRVSETGPDGSTTTWDYDGEGNVAEVSRLVPLDPTNVTWVTVCYAYDALGRRTATWTTNRAARVGTPAETVAYDALGRAVSRTAPGRGTAAVSYSADGLTVTNAAPNGATAVTRRAADGAVVSVTGTAVTPEFVTYGILADGTRWTRTTRGETADSPRFETRFENMLGEVVRVERGGFRGAVLATVNSYDDYGRLVSTESDGEPAVAYAYDALGERVATVRSADGQWRRAESHSGFALVGSDVWTVQTNVTSCSDAAIAPLVTSRAVQLTGLTAANPSRSRTTDARGNATEEWTEFAGGVTAARRRVPGASNVATVTSRCGVELGAVSVSAVTSTTLYDALGRISATVDGRGNATRTEYDAYGRRVAAIDPAGARTSYAYDVFGNLAAVTNAIGNAVVYEYDLRGRKTYEGGATYPVRYAYDVFGNRVSMTTYRDESPGPGSGDTTRWLHDGATGVVTSKVYADGRGPSYDYDANGRLTGRTWARGVATAYAYDGWGNLTNTAYSDGTPAVALSYDAMGRQVRVVDAAGTTTFAYDAFGAVTNETVIGVAGTNALERLYDAVGRDAGYALNGVRQSTLAYDPATGRLATMIAAGGGAPFVWGYLPGSDLKSSLTYPNGLSASWDYDGCGRLTRVRNASATDVVSQYGYAYDAAGRRVSCAKSGTAFAAPDTCAYGYSARGELTNATAAADAAYRYGYQFDDIGNRETSSDGGTNRTYAANGLNQYDAVDGFAPAYDADGNQTLVRTSTGTWRVSYNGENRPIRWESGDTVITMSFDRMGRRVAKGDRRFAYDGYLQVADSAGNAYVWDPTEPAATRPLAWVHGGAVAYYTHDGNKNVGEVVAADGTLAAHYGYAPFGSVVSLSGEWSDCNFWRFSSEYMDDDIGILRYNFRGLNPVEGTWLTRDPASEDVSLNLYLFINGNPIGNFDVLGLLADATHGTTSCKKTESCDVLADKLEQWKTHYQIRHRELAEDKYCLKVKDPKRYNNHIDKINESKNNISRCLDLISQRCPDACPPAVQWLPDPAKIQIPSVIPQARWWDNVNWDCVGYTVGFGFLAVGAAVCPFDGPCGETVFGTLMLRNASCILK